MFGNIFHKTLKHYFCNIKWILLFNLNVYFYLSIILNKWRAPLTYYNNTSIFGYKKATTVELQSLLQSEKNQMFAVQSKSCFTSF